MNLFADYGKRRVTCTRTLCYNCTHRTKGMLPTLLLVWQVCFKVLQNADCSIFGTKSYHIWLITRVSWLVRLLTTSCRNIRFYWISIISTLWDWRALMEHFIVNYTHYPEVGNVWKSVVDLNHIDLSRLN